MIRTVRDFYFRSDQAKAYTLLSPALILVIIAMAAPMIVMIITSFNTQISMIEIDRTFTTGRYEDFFSKPIFSMLLFRSVKISFFVTLLTLITTYPLAYYIAFYVKKNKMLWIVLMTLPFWTSYL